jgi:uncharacterized membrane protein
MLDEEEEDRGDAADNGHNGGVFSELKGVASDAALAVLAPVAKQAATKAAKYAVKKAPELMEDRVLPMLEDAGGARELVGQVMSSDGPGGGLLSKLTGGDENGGGDAGDGTGKGRRMPVQQAVDVAAPIDIVYDQWTQFEDYPKFMHRVERVEQEDDAHVVFHAKVWGINRRWETEIVEQRPDERIVFKTVNGMQLTGVVTFHDLAERLTRIELNLDVDPEGPIEKMARGMRVIKRAARADLKRFKAYVEMHEDETGAWRGEIQDGDVVSESDEDREDDYYDEDEEEPEAAYDDEYEDDEIEDEEEEDEAEAAPRRKPSARTKSSSNGGGARKSSARTKSSSKRSSGSTSRRGSSSGSKTKRSSSRSTAERSSGSRSSASKRTRGSSSKSSSSSRSRKRSSSSGSSSKGRGRAKSSSRGRAS